MKPPYLNRSEMRIRKSRAKTPLVVVVGVLLMQLTLSAMCGTRDEYVVPIGYPNGFAIDPSVTMMANVDSQAKVSDASDARYSISVTESGGGDGGELLLTYSFHQLSLGSEVAIKGQIYTVDQVKYEKGVHGDFPSTRENASNGASYPAPGSCLDGCNNFIRLKKVGSVPEMLGANGFVLSNGPDDAVNLGACSFALSIAHFANGRGATVGSVTLKVKELEWSVKYPALCDGVKNATEKVFKVGDSISLPGMSGFRVVSLIAATKSHAGWVLLVPVSGETH